ncbi:MAG: LysM peptidoglycan-binding domain-containing protein [Rhodospirillales bacterium]|nr:LysM peptidoglycan-binding domain-containing protein [Rhodospirillales bacterium]
MPSTPLTIIAAVGGAAIALAIGVNVVLWKDEIETPPAPVVATDTATKQTAKNSQPASETLPAFDVVRIGPKGNTVIAGRAKPGSTVVILDNGKPIGEVIADARGDWVFVPDKPLSPGSRELSLKMILPGGEQVISDNVVVLVVPERGKDIAGRDTQETTNALAFKTPRAGGPSTLLQHPTGPPAKGLRIETLDYDDAGRLVISGRAEPKALVSVYLDNAFIGRATANADGLWRLRPQTAIKPGLYTLRADQTDAKGKVMARVSIPFSRAEPISDAHPEPFIIVQPGNSLWRMARRAYGEGTRYTTIFQANKDQIKNPDMIFPGQVFALPVTN